MYLDQLKLGHIERVLCLLAAWCLDDDALREVSNFLVGLLPHKLWYLCHLAALKREINVTWSLIDATLDFLGAFKITEAQKNLHTSRQVLLNKYCRICWSYGLKTSGPMLFQRNDLKRWGHNFLLILTIITILNWFVF